MGNLTQAFFCLFVLGRGGKEIPWGKEGEDNELFMNRDFLESSKSLNHVSEKKNQKIA